MSKTGARWDLFFIRRALTGIRHIVTVSPVSAPIPHHRPSASEHPTPHHQQITLQTHMHGHTYLSNIADFEIPNNTTEHIEIPQRGILLK